MIILEESHTDVIAEMQCVKGNERVESTKITSCIVILGLNAERRINAAHLQKTEQTVTAKTAMLLQF